MSLLSVALLTAEGEFAESDETKMASLREVTALLVEGDVARNLPPHGEKPASFLHSMLSNAPISYAPTVVP